MDHFAGLDVSVKETSVCIVDDTGRIVREVKVASEPEARPRRESHQHDGITLRGLSQLTFATKSDPKRTDGLRGDTLVGWSSQRVRRCLSK